MVAGKRLHTHLFAKNNNRARLACFRGLASATPSDFPSWAYEPKDYFRFEVLHKSSKSLARVGRITTPHGYIDTPGYVAVGTNAALKAVDFPSADNSGQQLIFSNTYHLILHPGPDVIREAGGKSSIV